MGEMFTGISVPSELKRVSYQQANIQATTDKQFAENIFSQRMADFSTTEGSYLTKVFEEALAERAYKNTVGDLNLLGKKERIFDTAQRVSTDKFIKHEKELKADPEVAALESKITENKSKIQEKQNVLTKKVNVETVHQELVKTNSALKESIAQLNASELTLVNDIDSIKTQISDIKSGKISLSDLQINVTGSASTSAVDMESFAKSNSSAVAVVGGQQVAISQETKEALEALKSNSQSGQIQEEIEKQIINAIVEALEDTLSKKEQDLAKTRKQIKHKEQQLKNNQGKLDSFEGSNNVGEQEVKTVEQELEELIRENLDLVQERIDKDPELVAYTKTTSIYNNLLKGSGDAGSGVVPEKAKTSEELDEKKGIYNEKSSQTETFEDTLNIKEFLKNEAKSNLSNSKLAAQEKTKLFENFKLKNGN